MNRWRGWTRRAKRGPNRILYFHTDVNGAPEEMTDSDGKIVWETGYQVWGNTIQEKGHGRVEQNLRYQGTVPRQGNGAALQSAPLL